MSKKLRIITSLKHSRWAIGIISLFMPLLAAMPAHAASDYKLCYGNDSYCMYFNSSADIITTNTSPTTNFVQIGGVTDAEFEQAGTSKCLTWNQSLGDVDEIACAKKSYQTWELVAVTGTKFAMESNYNGLDCLQANQSAGFPSLKTCNYNLAAQQWEED
jgi:hypothetical protein